MLKRKKIMRPLGGKARHSGKSKIGKFLYWLVFILFAGAVAYMLFFSPFMAVSRIEARGAETIGNGLIAEKAAAEIAGKYFNFLGKNNFIILPKKRIADALKNEFIKIDTVEMAKKFPDGLEISVKEKRVAVVLCSGDSCFTIDDAGVAYAPADFSANRLGENELPIIRDESEKPIEQGGDVLEIGYIDFILDIRNKISSGLDIGLEKEMRVPGIAAGDIRLAATEGWRIFLDKNIPAEKEVEMLRISLNKIDAEKRKELDYVDLRINNKVFYKFR